MEIPGITLTRQIGAGADGTSYAGVHDATGRAVEVRRLFFASKDPQRWRVLVARLRLVASIDDPGVRRIVDSRLHGSQPYVVLEAKGEPLEAGGQRSASVEARELAATLARVLAHAHRLGLVHGALDANAIELGANGPRIDLCGTHTGTEPQLRYDALREDDLAALHLLMNELRASGEPELPSTVPARPSTAQAFDDLRLIAEGKLPGEDTIVQSTAEIGEGAVLGRFRVMHLLGEGGMGRVFLAEDLGSGGRIALKVVRPERCTTPILHRFHREAMLLERLSNRHIARFVDVNEQDGVHYLAMEYVEGPSLSEVMKQGPMPRDEALALTADIARALADIHAIGLVHRDIKPSNILLEETPEGRRMARLCDFGLARDIGDDTQPELTEHGAILGTPIYMSPEQYRAMPADARSDVYSLGVTLFAMLAGRTPYEGDTAALARGHLDEPVPDIAEIRDDIDPDVARLLERMLAKDPDERPANGGELLAVLEVLRWRKAPTDIHVHPILPRGDNEVLSYSWSWDLSSSPGDLWPYVSDTDRVNRAVGLPAVSFDRVAEQRGDGDAFARARSRGVDLAWREHPFEWVAPHRFGVLREYDEGPFRWLRSTVELHPLGSGGTRLTHTVEVDPRGIIGRAAAAIEIGRRAKKNLERVYARIDETLSSATKQRDPFEDGGRRGAQQVERVELARSGLLARGADARVTGALCEYLRTQPPQVLARIRPRSFARRFGLEERDVVKTFLQATEEGALLLLWDLICPSCRVAASLAETLAELREHAHCEACRIDFEVDLGSSVELVFRAHPDIAPLDLRTYCIGGPAHCPHVLAQVRIEPGERIELPLVLTEGTYRIQSRQLETVWQLRVHSSAKLARWDIALTRGPDAHVPRSLTPGAQEIVLLNDLEHPALVRLERADEDGHALTAAEATCIPGFRELFPDQVLAPDQLVSVSRVVLFLVSEDEPREMDEREAFTRLRDLQEAVVEAASLEGGAIVKIHRHGVMAAFVESVAATRAALSLMQARPGARIAMHAGRMMVTNINGRLDYYGRVVQEADAILDCAEPGQLSLSEAVTSHPDVPTLVADRDVALDLVGPSSLLVQIVGGQAARAYDVADTDVGALASRP